MKSKLQTSISPDYVKNWDMGKAIRELIQNYLDSKQEFNCDGYLRWENGKAIIKDYGPGLELKHFAMGVSEKSSNARGKYGEGLKLALLTMARENVPVELWTRGSIIRPVIEYNEAYQTDLLAFEIEPLPYQTHKGTTLKFDCTQEEFEEGKSYFIDFYKWGNEEFEWVESNKISRPGGYIFVNGTRVGELRDSIFSYHLQESEVGDIGNRDREVIDMNEVSQIISTMFAKLESSIAIQAILSRLASGKTSWESESLRIYEWDIPRGGKAWIRASRAVFGANAVFPTGNSKIDRQAEYHGYRLIYGLGWKWERLLEEIGAIPRADKVLKEASHNSKLVAQKNLNELEQNNLAYAKRIVKSHYLKDESLRVSIVENLALMSNGTSTEVQGLWNPKKKMIYLNRKILTDKKETLFTLLHEAVHQSTGFMDCTAEFEHALLDIGVKALMQLDDCQEK